MNIFKTVALALLCGFSASAFGQDKKEDSHNERLNHDIMIWSARNDVVDNVNSVSLKVLAAAAVLAGCGGCGFYLYNKNFHLRPHTFLADILAYSSFGALCISYVTAQLAAGVWSINMLLLLYTKYHLSALKGMKERLIKTQKTA